jgi:HEAT repeat protein
MAARDAGVQTELHADFVRDLHDELDGDGKSKQHRSWAALAAAIWGRTPEHESADIVEHMRKEYADERDPLIRGAFAIGLGLLGDKGSGDQLTADFAEQKDPGLRAHLAVALGLIGHDEASDVLRGSMRSRALPPHSRVEVALGLGLMGDPTSVPVLIEGLDNGETLGLIAGHAKALGLIGDGRAVEPLLAVIADDDRSPMTRGFGCVALGMLCEKQALPFNARIKMNNNYRAQVPSVAEVLDIL